MKPRVAGGECQVTSCTCIVMHLYRMCSSRAGTGSKMNKKPPVCVERETQRETPENKPSSATAGAPPASGASTCGEKRATTRKTETAKGFGSAGSRARRRTKATEATGQGARSTSARVGHHANVERGARREQDTSCARGGSRDAGRRSAPSQFEQQRLLCVGPFRGSGPSRNTRKRESGWRGKSTHPRKAAARRRMEPPGARPAT
jgi:hypothetical protein